MITIHHLETNVTSLCQNNCVACNHFVPLMRDHNEFADPAQVEHDLAILGRMMHVERYGMLGGEPTLNKGLVDILKIARASKIADKLEVWTNGQTLERMSDAFWASFDALVVSVYPGKHTPETLTWIAIQCERRKVELIWKDERNAPNFTTILEPTATDPRTTQRKYDRCFFKGYSRVVDNGFFYRCCTSPYIPRLLLGQPAGTDGLALTERTTETELALFLNQRHAMASCGICTGRASGRDRKIPWSEIRDPERWKRASAGIA